MCMNKLKKIRHFLPPGYVIGMNRFSFFIDIRSQSVSEDNSWIIFLTDLTQHNTSGQVLVGAII